MELLRVQIWQNENPKIATAAFVVHAASVAHVANVVHVASVGHVACVERVAVAEHVAGLLRIEAEILFHSFFDRPLKRLQYAMILE
jgi:hypothetical protein